MPRLKATLILDEKDEKRLEDIIKILEGYGVDSQRVLDNEAHHTLRKMKDDAPRDTGRLERNIQAQTLVSGGVEFTSEAIDPETGDDYAFIQEHGSRFVKAQPYFFRNIRAWRRRAENSLRQLFRNYTSLGQGHRSRRLRNK